jgi:hypothetical protein
MRRTGALRDGCFLSDHLPVLAGAALSFIV